MPCAFSLKLALVASRTLASSSIAKTASKFHGRNIKMKPRRSKLGVAAECLLAHTSIVLECYSGTGFASNRPRTEITDLLIASAAP